MMDARWQKRLTESSGSLSDGGLQVRWYKGLLLLH